jgi:hypothetical protein
LRTAADWGVKDAEQIVKPVAQVRALDLDHAHVGYVVNPAASCSSRYPSSRNRCARTRRDPRRLT